MENLAWIIILLHSGVLMTGDVPQKLRVALITKFFLILPMSFICSRYFLGECLEASLIWLSVCAVVFFDFQES
jgi:hypothetical protein